MPQKSYHVKLDDGREFNVTTDGPPPAEEDILAQLPAAKEAPEEDAVAAAKATLAQPSVPEQAPATKPYESPGLIRTAIDLATKPLVEAPSRWAKRASEYINPESTTAGVRGIGSAYLEGLGNAISGLSSPLNLAMTAATGGAMGAARAGLPTVARTLSTAGRGLAATMIPEGVYHAATAEHPEDVLSGILEAGMGAYGARGHLGRIADEAAKPTGAAEVVADLKAKLAEATKPVEEPTAQPIRDKSGRVVAYVDRTNLPERPAGPWESNKPPDEQPTIKPKPTEEAVYDIAREKHQMGLEPPASEPIARDRSGLLGVLDRAKTNLEEIGDFVADTETGEVVSEAKPVNLNKAGIPQFNRRGKTGETGHPFDWSTVIKIPHKADTVTLYRGGHIERDAPISPEDLKAEGVSGDFRYFTDDLEHAKRFAASRGEPVWKIEVPKSELGKYVNPRFTKDIDFSKEPEPGKGFESGPNVYYVPMEEAAKATKIAEAGKATEPPARTITLEGGKVKSTPKEYIEGKPQVSTGELRPENVRPETLEGKAPPPTATGTGGKPPIKPPDKRLLFDEELNRELPVRERKYREPPEQSKFSQAWNTARSLQSVDLPGITSAALRQSRPLAFTTDWFKAWNSAWRSFGSDEALRAINDKIRANPYFKPRYEPIYNRAGEVTRYIERPSVAESLGVKMTDIIGTREEAFASSLAEKIPGYGRYVKASNRAYTGFLNDLRAAKFTELMEAAKVAGEENNVVLGKALADFVNNATGRGSLSYFGGRINLESNAKLLGNTLYSPRALSARLAFMNPANYLTAPKMVRMQYWGGLARIGVSWGAFTGLASLIPGVHVSLDPRNADFGKIRIGDTRIDPGAGWLQLMVLMSREAAGGTVSSTSAPGKPGKFTPFGKYPGAATMLSLPGRYLYNQMNPSLRYVFDMLSATRKEPFDLTDRTLQAALPFYITDIADAAKSDSAVAQFFAPIISSIGGGVQSYEKGSYGKPVITPAIKKYTGVDVPTAKIYR